MVNEILQETKLWWSRSSWFAKVCRASVRSYKDQQPSCSPKLCHCCIIDLLRFWRKKKGKIWGSKKRNIQHVEQVSSIKWTFWRKSLHQLILLSCRAKVGIHLLKFGNWSGSGSGRWRCKQSNWKFFVFLEIAMPGDRWGRGGHTQDLEQSDVVSWRIEWRRLISVSHWSDSTFSLQPRTSNSRPLSLDSIYGLFRKAVSAISQFPVSGFDFSIEIAKLRTFFG